jgi:uncharacterized protein with von Willebrand factor type A (vWA) domain
VVEFCRLLRDRGLEVTPAMCVDAARAIVAVDVLDRDEVRAALRIVLVSHHEDEPTFEAAFDEFWRARKAPVGMPFAAPNVRVTRTSAPPSARRPNAVSLERWMRAVESPDETLSTRAASTFESLRQRDFADYAAEDAHEFRRVVAQLARRLALRPSRRWKSSRRGERYDLRRTVRSSLRTGGDAVELERRTRKLRRTKLVALCDVSGSMELYASFLVQFLHALQNVFGRVETFVFATRLSRITTQLRGARLREALRSLGRDVTDWSGGTRIGASLHTFLETWGHRLDQHTVVLVLSDGWDSGDPAELGATMAELRRRVSRVFWLNPLAGSPGYRPETRGMVAALPHVDVFASAHNLESLRVLVRQVVGK